MNWKRILVTGCGGMLGSAVYPYLLSLGKNVLPTDKNANEDWLTELDVRNETRLRRVFDDFRPDLVLHMAAETDLEYCEMHADVAVETNSVATRTVADLCSRTNATLTYISTAGVFDGKKDAFYTEADQPVPISVYGRTKYVGEINALKTCPHTYVIRAGWMMGGGRKKERKFIYKILKQIKQKRKEIFAVDNLWGTPTYSIDLAMNIFRLLKAGQQYGVYHMVCGGQGTRYDVAEAILDICNRTDIRLTRVGSDFFKDEYFVERPKTEMLINQKLTRLGLNYMRPWKVALRDYIEDYFLDFIENPSKRVIEQRKHRRIGHSSFVRFTEYEENNGNEHAGTLIDVSISGIGFTTVKALKLGQMISIKKAGKDQEPWQKSVVQYVNRENGRYKVGIEFLYENPYAVTELPDIP